MCEPPRASRGGEREPARTAPPQREPELGSSRPAHPAPGRDGIGTDASETGICRFGSSPVPSVRLTS